MASQGRRRAGPRACPLLALAALGSLYARARGCTVLRLQGSGFASNAIHVLHAVPVYDGTNGTLFLDSSRFRYACEEGGGWHDFFATQDLLVPWSPAKEEAAGEACEHVTFSDVDYVLHTRLKVGWDSVNAEGAARAWRLQQWVQDRVDEQLKGLALLARPVIGFHVRHGDKVAEDQALKRKTTEPEDYVATVADAWPDVQGGTCIVLGDELSKLEEAGRLAAEALGCRLHRTEPYYNETGHSQDAFNALPLGERCMATLQLLVDIEVLAHTDYLVGSLNSGLPHLIEVLRYALYGKARNTFADASAAHYDWASKIRALFPRNRRPAGGRERRYWGDAAPRLRSLAELLWGAAT